MENNYTTTRRISRSASSKKKGEPSSSSFPSSTSEPSSQKLSFHCAYIATTDWLGGNMQSCTHLAEIGSRL